MQFELKFSEKIPYIFQQYFATLYAYYRNDNFQLYHGLTVPVIF